MKPTKGNVFIVPETSGLNSDTIIIPETTKGRDIPQFGRVVAIGGKPITKKGVVTQPEFKVGDRIMFQKFGGLFVERGSIKYFSVKQHHVIAILG
jgi:co-chaperonin GroES (HSP10)